MGQFYMQGSVLRETTTNITWPRLAPWRRTELAAEADTQFRALDVGHTGGLEVTEIEARAI